MVIEEIDVDQSSKSVGTQTQEGGLNIFLLNGNLINANRKRFPSPATFCAFILDVGMKKQVGMQEKYRKRSWYRGGITFLILWNMGVYDGPRLA